MTAPTTDLSWRDAETIDAARSAIACRAGVRLNLPAGFHNALCVRFAPPSSLPRTERMDIERGAELLARIPQIRGQESIADLEAPAHVHVVSPSPTIVISCEREKPAEHPSS